MAAARTTQQSSLAPFVLPAGLAGAAVGVWFGYPGLVLLLFAILLWTWTEPVPHLTGPRKNGVPTPASDREERRMRSYRVVIAMRTTTLPGPAWLPGWPVRVSWAVAVALGAVAYSLPVLEPTWRWVNAAGVAITVLAWVSARRHVSGSPGGRWNALSGSGLRLVVETLGCAVVGAVAGWGLASLATALLDGSPGGGTSTPWPAVCVAAGAVCGAGAVTARASIAPWRAARAVDTEWGPRWAMLKVDPAPVCLSTREVVVGGQQAGRASVFAATGGRGVGDFLVMASKIAPMIDAGEEVFVLTVPSTSSTGEMPGTVHPSRFEVVTLDKEAWPDVGDPSIDPDVVELAARIALTDGAEPGMPVLPVTVESITEPGANRAAYKIGLTWPYGPGASNTRVSGAGAAGMTRGRLGDAALDHRVGDGGMLYVGDLGSDDLPEDMWAAVERIVLEDEWIAVWKATAKTDVNPPVIVHQGTARAELADGTVIDQHAFAARQGMDPMEYATPGVERKLTTAVNGATFMAVTGWVTGASRAGERHGSAFAVYSSTSRLPSTPEALEPTRGNGPKWVLTGHVNRAFDHVRQSRPQIVSVRCLTKSSARKHTWEISLRLYGGVAFGDVRTFGERLRQAFGSPWLRVADAPDGCLIYVGSKPDPKDLASPRRDADRVVRLDWDQAWTDAKIAGVGGRTPKILASDRMPANEKVHVLDFELPPGLDVKEVREAIPKLRTNTSSAFVQVEQGKHGANSIRVLTCADDPMPFPAGFDYEKARTAKRHEVFFGGGVSGDACLLDTRELAHLLVVGLSGSGKSVFVQSLLSSWAMKPAEDAEFYVIDIQKKGADFRFLSPYTSGEAYTAREAEALMRAIYAKAKERLDRNAELGVGNVTDWETPPPQMVVVIDEFTSLITTENVSQKPLDDPELEAARLEVIADNDHRTNIGQYAGKFARELRSAGVTMILATQQIKADTLKKIPGGDTMRAQLARALLGKASWGEKAAALKQPSEAADLGEMVPKGRGLFETSMHNGVPIQGWFEPDLARLAAAVAEARSPVPPEDRIDISPFLAKEVDQGPAVSAVSVETFRPDSDEPLEVIDLEADGLEISLDDLEPGTETPAGAEPQAEAPEVEAVPEDPVDPWADWDWGVAEPAAPDGEDEFSDPNAVPLSVPAPREDGFTFDADEF